MRTSSESQKDLGLIVSRSLSWKANINLRCSKAMKSFYMIKRSIVADTHWHTKKNLFRSFIVRILSYGSELTKLGKSELRAVEQVQIHATKWILKDATNDYKTRLQILKLLPISLYHELHVLLLFIKILNGKYRMNWEDSVTISEENRRTRQGNVS